MLEVREGAPVSGGWEPRADGGGELGDQARV